MNIDEASLTKELIQICVKEFSTAYSAGLNGDSFNFNNKRIEKLIICALNKCDIPKYQVSNSFPPEKETFNKLDTIVESIPKSPFEE